MKKFSGDQWDVFSAGVRKHGLNPYAVRAMAEAGIDISKQTSNHVDEYSGIRFDVAITICDHAREVCPVLPGAKRMIHHTFEDPADAKGREEEIMPVYRKVRDEIREYCRTLTSALPENGQMNV